MDLQDALILVGTLGLSAGIGAVAFAVAGLCVGIGTGVAVGGAIALWLATRGVPTLQRDHREGS